MAAEYAELSDNGAVPVEQGGTGATTIQGTIDAFGIFLAISAAAAYDPEGSYAVGDYCTQGGKLYKCNMPIPDGEAWNEAHWNETSVAAELENASSSLSNKVGFSSDLCTDADDLFQMYQFFPVGVGTSNIPPTDFGGIVNFGYSSVVFAQLMFERHGFIYVRGYAGWQPEGSRFTDWVKIVTAIPPQVRNLTLQPGFTKNNDCTFFVTQESTVHLAGGVSGTLPANQDTQIGTLQADARPTYQCRRPAVTNAGAAYIDIHTDGTVWAHPFAAASECWFDTSFVAGGGQ